jgi:hypothetical protein
MKRVLEDFLESSSPEQLREELEKGNRPLFQTMKDDVSEKVIPFTKENFEALLTQNTDLANTLQGIIDGCVHLDVAVRAVMVDLAPLRKILKKNTEFINKLTKK